jgi:outer membrane protein assembly factor BamB
VFASWLLPSGGEINVIDTLTIATGIETKTSGDAEIWRLGTSGRLAGLTATADGKSLISAANIPPQDDVNIGGIVKLDVSDGSILDQFIWPENALDLPHNAFTNPLVDTDGATYYIDSLLGLVKFEGDALNDGPVWSAVGGYYGKVLVKEMSAESVPTSEIDVRRLEETAPFTAFKPALDETSSTVYGCGMTTRGDEYDGVVALESSKGYKVWHTKFDDYQVVNVGSCRGITDDIIFGPSSWTSSGNAVYAVRENVIYALDPKNGTTVWTWEMYDGPGATKFVVVSDSLVIAANTGLVVGLGTSEPDNSTEVPSVSPTAAPVPATPRPTRTPLPPTDAPTASASTLGFTFFATALAALPLVLALLR